MIDPQENKQEQSETPQPPRKRKVVGARFREVVRRKMVKPSEVENKAVVMGGDAQDDAK